MRFIANRNNRLLLSNKGILISLIFFVFNYNSWGQKNQNCKDYELKGKVKSVSIRIYNAVEKFGEATKSDLKEEKKLLFDANGKILKEDASNKGVIKYYFYDSNRQPVEVIMLTKKQDTTKTLDDEDEEIMKITASNEQPDTTTITKIVCDSKGNIIEESDFDKLGNLKGKRINKYTQNGTLLIVDEAEYSANGSQIGSDKIEKYAGKNLVESSNEINQRESSRKYVYDTKNNLIKETFFYNNSQLGTSTNKYDQDNFLIEAIQATFDGVKRSVTYKYTKDTKSNYTSKITFMAATYNGMNNKMEAKEIEERVIEYY